MNPLNDSVRLGSLQWQTRRHFLQNCSLGLAGMWLGSQANSVHGEAAKPGDAAPMLAPHFPPKAKRVIFLHMAGGPSQLELFDYKPDLQQLDGKDTPASFLEGKRFAFIQGVPKMLGPQFPFAQHGESGAWVSDRLPHFQSVVDKVCFVKSMHTTQFNHAPAQLLLHTGSQNLGSASFGAWTMYGLGSENQNLPGFVVLVSGGKTPSAGKSVWGSGFLPSVHQGVQCRSKGDPVLYLSNPEGVSRIQRRRALDTLAKLNRETFEQTGDAEVLTRISQYEMAFRMQTSATEAFDLSQETADVHAMYGTKPGEESFANNCLLARRLAERDVRFIQLFHWGWDSHGAGANEAINKGFHDRCREVDQPMTALLKDLDQRGLLEDTLVVWGGEFGRTPMRENRGGREMKLIGRDHNPGAFTMWFAGGGIKPGVSIGHTDDIGYEAVENKVSPHDLHATLQHLLGIDHHKLTYMSQGLPQRLSNVTQPSRIVTDMFA
ncbi:MULTISPECIES: DUF1501 domain-containing protein [Rhodopirellula]|uniref:DUF1501 domain-containing protein n=1 Tax=Rhodopirellula TaxID=265488 RepID=UPI00258072A9|nr:DUF1501 domain-containing protein [Rhodopirellula sp. UBA1907]|tara:strand:+ start:36844 stop:38316 length:1473 start_codon:yes stop_codon:yes gene_type:complete